jgi:lysozyme-like protein
MPQLSDREIAGAVKAAGFPRASWNVAIAVALAESGGNSDALNDANTNGSSDYGLFQINSVHADLLKQHNWRDPVQNAQMAKVISANGTSWRPWVAFTTGRYAAYLPRAVAATGSPTAPPSGGTPGGAATAVGLPTPGGNVFALLGSQRTWLRVGMILIGFLLVLIAVIQMTGAERLIPAGRIARKVMK